ncbi:MAG: hypothetical protein MSC30_06265 [Gaiellaceae bacterium MAG52_C11]|nr:hypothetical protein [Candidatus Gaiellasilicea maunaloa]
MDVVDPDGVAWTVGRRWLELPRWRRRGWRPTTEGLDFPFLADDFGAGLFLILLGVLLFLLLGGLPLLVGLAAVLVALAGLVTRVVFGRPWLVEARSTRGGLAWRVRGTRDSKRAVRLIARAMEVGDRDYSPPRSTRVPSHYSVSKLS